MKMFSGFATALGFLKPDALGHTHLVRVCCPWTETRWAAASAYLTANIAVVVAPNQAAAHGTIPLGNAFAQQAVGVLILGWYR